MRAKGVNRTVHSSLVLHRNRKTVCISEQERGEFWKKPLNRECKIGAELLNSSVPRKFPLEAVA